MRLIVLSWYRGTLSEGLISSVSNKVKTSVSDEEQSFLLSTLRDQTLSNPHFYSVKY